MPNQKKVAASPSKKDQATRSMDLDVEENLEELPVRTRSMMRELQGLPPTPRRHRDADFFERLTSNAPNASSSYQSNPPSKAGSPLKAGSPTKPGSLSKARNAFGQNSETTTELLAPSQFPSQATESSIGTAITNKEQLEQLTPSVSFDGPATLKESFVPDMVKVLWTEHLMHAINATAYVPLERKDMLEKTFDTPMKTKSPLPQHVYAKNLYDIDDLDGVVEAVKNALSGANHNRGHSHEGQWTGKAFDPLMTQLCKLTPFMRDGFERIEDLNINHVSISPKILCPKSTEGVFTTPNRKIDHALALRLSATDRAILSGGKYRMDGPASINQTTSSYTALRAMFAHYEIKTDGRDPLIQAGVWIVALFMKFWNERLPMDLPAIVIIVDEDFWILWIACAVVRDCESRAPFRVQFIGPWLIGNTMSIADTFKVFHFLKAVAGWGINVYEPWYQDNILARYRK